MSPLPRVFDGVRHVAAESNAFIVDQWGVLHDGHTLHPGAVHALRRLRERGPVALVSNTSRRVEAAQAHIRRLGLHDHEYDAFVTAGELAALWLESHISKRDTALRVLTLPCDPDPDSLLADQPVTHTKDISDADAIVILGITSDDPAQWDPLLHAGAARGLPLLCANPDVRSLQPDGSYCWCPGAFAARYADIGGTVHTFGKPGRDIYHAAMAAMGPHDRVAAFGDSLEHDIVGANRMGFTSVLVTRGIHGPDLGLAPTERPKPAAVAALAASYSATVHVAVPTFRW